MAGYSYVPRYVRNATSGCQSNGCAAPELAAMARRLSDQQHEVLETLSRNEGQVQPTKALWCEQSGHSFSEKDPDLQVLTISGRGPDGQTVEESRTICGECAALTKTQLGKTHQQAIKPVTE